MLVSIRRAVEDGIPFLDGDYLATVTRADLERVFRGTTEMPMLDERVRIFNEVGRVLAETYDGRFHRFTASCAPRLYAGGDGLLERLVSEFPRFDDVSAYGSARPQFYKLAQLALWMTYASLHERNRFPIEDMDQMTAFADYIVPVGLRVMGILEYSAELEAAIAARTEIPAGSAWEVELRAHSLFACDLLRAELNARRPAGSAADHAPGGCSAVDALPHDALAPPPDPNDDVLTGGSTAEPDADTPATSAWDFRLCRRSSGGGKVEVTRGAWDAPRDGTARGPVVNDLQFEKMKNANGFIAALDQSGGSTPSALRRYGVDETAYASEAEMFDRIHEMRARIITSPAFTGERILGSILFEQTMDRQIDGSGTAEYLWEQKNVVPFLKVDRGLADESNGAKVMKPIPGLDSVLVRAKAHGVFGTKMRSVIKLADPTGVAAVVGQQFEVGRLILAAGLVPILEPEVDINSPQKEAAEVLLKAELLAGLDELPADQHVMLKLTLPEQDGFHAELVGHPRVLRVVALSGGYTRAEANARLARNHGVVASFSRALTEGLTAQMSDAEFDAALDASIESIYQASVT